MNDDNNTTKKCIICGCTGHAFFGCFTHWTGHKKNQREMYETVTAAAAAIISLLIILIHKAL
jgi:hypothetical protein